MPKRVVFSWGKPSAEEVKRAERQTREWMEAGLCGECGHARHEMLRCGVQVEGLTVRQCFGANPHTRTEYRSCMCLADTTGYRKEFGLDIVPLQPHERTNR